MYDLSFDVFTVRLISCGALSCSFENCGIEIPNNLDFLLF